jgi:phosphate uptake regulator
MSSPADPVFSQAIGFLGEKSQGMLTRVVRVYLDNNERRTRDISAEDEEVDSALKNH